MKIVELDTKIFKGNKPISWHKIDKDYVYNNLTGKTMTIYNEDGSIEETDVPSVKGHSQRTTFSDKNIPLLIMIVILKYKKSSFL